MIFPQNQQLKRFLHEKKVKIITQGIILLFLFRIKTTTHQVSTSQLAADEEMRAAHQLRQCKQLLEQ